MASIYSVTGTLSSTSALRGYGGLSSGLDRDSLIESLTYGTRTKIENQQAKKTKIEWQQTELRSIIDKAYNFTNSYTSYTSSTNLSSSSFFARNNISVTGTNSKYVSVSGTSSSADQMTILGVKQLAADAKLTGGAASSSTLTTGAIDFSKQVPVDNLANTYMNVKVGDGASAKTYSIDIESLDLENKTVQQAIADALNKEFEKEGIGAGSSSAVKFGAEVSGDTVVISASTGGNKVSISGALAEKLGIVNEEGGETAVNGNITIGKDAVDEAVTYKTASEILAGKTLTFSYNGVSKNIKLTGDVGSVEAIKNTLQKQLDDAFGKGRISVGEKDGALTFTTMNVQNGGVDSTSTLSITGGSNGLLGNDGVFGVKSGASNKVDLSKTLAASGLANIGSGSGTLVINGVDIGKDLNGSETVQQIMDKINNSGAGVKISYSSGADKFSIIATDQGASGSIEMSGTIAEAMFGASLFTEDANGVKTAKATGQDAIIAVQYAGDSEPTEIYRGTNSFNMDGLTVNVNGTFGYQGDTIIGETEAVKFEASADVDKIMKAITDMVNAYNEIVKTVNSELKSKPDKDYKNPLTGSQKEEMSDDAIKEYEEKAKQGLLFGDSDLRNFSMDLRYVLAGSDLAKLAEIGITESAEYSDNGKLVIDETKLRAALETDPESVGELFAGKDNPDGTSTAGLVDNMKSVMDKYCGTVGATKGILVERAGSEHSPLSLLQNTMKSQIDEIAEYMERLLDRLENEEDRYIKQFTSLETLISEMNSQSSYLSSISGGSY